ncbi:MAG: multidrug effflux MFS transporter [Rickettsiaceae bacterium]|nr:multidrug effflux MFS transporter [Rickettsiaceae bacterium]
MKIVGQISPRLLYCLVSLSTLTETIYSAALPEIADQLNTDASVAQLSTTVYYLGFALGIFSLGRISDIYGRRPIVLFGLALYIMATFLISQSTSIEFFIFMRLFQAYGASVGSVIAQSMARDSYKGWELSYIYASVSIIMSVVPTVGSTIGGYIVEYSGRWQPIFHFLIAFSGILLLFYIKFLPETNPRIGKANEYKFRDVIKVAFRDKILLSYAYIVGAYNGICFGFYIQAPFVFIDGLEMSPSDYAKLFLILSAANLFGGLLCQRLVKNLFNIYKIKQCGLVISFIACLILVCSAHLITKNISDNYVGLMIFIPMAIHLMGHSLVVPMLLRNALESYRKVTGAAGSIFGFLYYTMTAIVSFIIASFYSSTINNYAYLATSLIASCIIVFYMSQKWKGERGSDLFS